MDRSEPALVPEWLKAASGSVSSGSGSSSSNHHFASSSHSDDHATGILSRNRLSLCLSDHDSPRTSAFTERASPLSYRRSTSSNGSLSHDKDSLSHSRPYSSFGKSHRDRDREKDDFRDRERPSMLDSGYRDFTESSILSSRSDKDTLRRSQSMVSGRRVESWPKRIGNDTNNGALSTGSIVSSIHRASFDRDFPSLGAEDKQGPPEIGRVASPGLSSAVQSLPLGSSAIIGGDGWTSALVEVPVVIGGNGPLLSSVQQMAPVTLTPMASSTTTGLNMAETLAQAPLRARAAPQISVETQRLEELAIKQSRQLIPMTPSMPKASVLNPSEKLKPKGARSGDFSTQIKAGQQSSQLVNHAFRGRSDVSKTSPVGNFQILNRERNGISPTARDAPSPNSSRVLNPHGINPSAATAPTLKSPNNPKLKAEGKAGVLPVIQTSFVDKRPSQAQNRNDFFNSIRKKTSSNNSIVISEKSGEQTTGSSTYVSQAEDSFALDSGFVHLMVNGNCDNGEDPERPLVSNGGQSSSCLDPLAEMDEEEARFLKSLGWEENAGEEALTAEEIDAFFKEYKKLRPSAKLCSGELQQAKTALPESGGASAGLSSSNFKTGA